MLLGGPQALYTWCWCVIQIQSYRKRVRHKADSHNLNAVSSYNSSFIQPQPSQQNSQPITTEAETKLMQNQFPKCFKMV